MGCHTQRCFQTVGFQLSGPPSLSNKKNHHAVWCRALLINLKKCLFHLPWGIFFSCFVTILENSTVVAAHCPSLESFFAVQSQCIETCSVLFTFIQNAKENDA